MNNQTNPNSSSSSSYNSSTSASFSNNANGSNANSANTTNGTTCVNASSSCEKNFNEEISAVNLTIIKEMFFSIGVLIWGLFAFIHSPCLYVKIAIKLIGSWVFMPFFPIIYGVLNLNDSFNFKGQNLLKKFSLSFLVLFIPSLVFALMFSLLLPKALGVESINELFWSTSSYSNTQGNLSKSNKLLNLKSNIKSNIEERKEELSIKSNDETLETKKELSAFQKSKLSPSYKKLIKSFKENREYLSEAFYYLNILSHDPENAIKSDYINPKYSNFNNEKNITINEINPNEDERNEINSKESNKENELAFDDNDTSEFEVMSFREAEILLDGDFLNNKSNYKDDSIISSQKAQFDLQKRSNFRDEISNELDNAFKDFPRNEEFTLDSPTLNVFGTESNQNSKANIQLKEKAKRYAPEGWLYRSLEKALNQTDEWYQIEEKRLAMLDNPEFSNSENPFAPINLDEKKSNSKFKDLVNGYDNNEENSTINTEIYWALLILIITIWQIIVSIPSFIIGKSLDVEPKFSHALILTFKVMLPNIGHIFLFTLCSVFMLGYFEYFFLGLIKSLVNYGYFVMHYDLSFLSYVPENLVAVILLVLFLIGNGVATIKLSKLLIKKQQIN
ncbi:MAG: hypothetical protein SPK04_04120 [Succinivibrionaceae bacterium]|nr:hypothetical protein [Succinivibrionaceae bacterium]